MAAPQALNLLLTMYGDATTAELLSEDSYIAKLIRFEQAVAQAQGELEIIPADIAHAVVRALDEVVIDREQLWASSRNVGYPVLPLIQQLDGQLPPALQGYLHWGLTTQDVMDSALVLQIQDVVAHQGTLLGEWGDSLARLTHEWSGSVAPARTHAQQAVPTTIGARFAIYLSQLAELTDDLLRAGESARCVSMHGAGGTSAAMGPRASDVRARVAELLSLRHSDTSWHVARQSLSRLTGVMATIAAVGARLAKEVIDLSRNEIGELSEAVGHLRGASSTMPQKANPIDAEAVIGLSWSCTANQVAMLRALEAGHERAAGEWQIEWAAVPTTLVSASSAFAVLARMCAGLIVKPDRAAANTASAGAVIMAEAYMMQLGPTLGREHAHDLVYRAARASSAAQIPLFDAVTAEANSHNVVVTEIEPEQYLGDCLRTCASAELAWVDARAALGNTRLGNTRLGNTESPQVPAPRSTGTAGHLDTRKVST